VLIFIIGFGNEKRGEKMEILSLLSYVLILSFPGMGTLGWGFDTPNIALSSENSLFVQLAPVLGAS
jgi:hypothetical protein